MVIAVFDKVQNSGGYDLEIDMKSSLDVLTVLVKKNQSPVEWL